MFEITAEDVKAALDRAEDKAQRFYGGNADMLAVLYAEELEHLSLGIQITKSCMVKMEAI